MSRTKLLKHQHDILSAAFDKYVSHDCLIAHFQAENSKHFHFPHSTRSFSFGSLRSSV